MTALQAVNIRQVAPVPWRNGGGVTRELLAWPNAQAWQLRVSVADIERDGPFSCFEGVDRAFAVLSGAGVTLGLGPTPVAATVRSDPVNFAGEDAPSCHLVNGPTRDLNLMVRRDAGRGHLVRAVPGSSWGHAAQRLAWRGVLCWSEARLILGSDTSARTEDLGAGTLAWQTGPGQTPWQLEPKIGEVGKGVEPLQAYWLGWEAL